MRTCCICGTDWVSGGTLIDGSVYHDGCYSRLSEQLEKLSRSETAARHELGETLSFAGALVLWLSESRRQEYQQRRKSLRLHLEEIQVRSRAIRDQVRQIYDVWLSYPPDWAERRELVIDRDGDWCANCGADALLHLHHQREIKQGGTHKIDNLVLLCEECHSKAHGSRKFQYKNKSDGRKSATPLEYRIALINEALATGKDLRMQYRRRDGKITTRTVTPSELRKLAPHEIQRLHKLLGRNVGIQKEGRLCLFAYCHLREANRTFAVDRIQNLRIE
jgi:5-methylcytosine-specific restriction endonuclease McrA